MAVLQTTAADSVAAVHDNSVPYFSDTWNTTRVSLLLQNDTDTNSTGGGIPGVDPMTIVFVAFYGIICIMGLIGNGLVIFVVVRYTKMKTVTNMYILNLAVADLCFLVGLPFLITTAILRNWIFGFAVCKIFFICTSINWYTSVFTLTVMSADRYMAVCHPVRSMRYRTPLVSRIVCVVIWTASLIVMLPIILYATTVTNPESNKTSCTINWPDGQPITAEKAFIWYSLLLGFAIPVALISVFYALVVLRLRTVGPKKKSKEKKKSHRKVTKMVLIVIAVYIICWLPYWTFQVHLTFTVTQAPPWKISLFQILTLMSYANSTLNPLIYAFLSENFRKSFLKAFSCAKPAEVNGTLHMENSVFPGKKIGHKPSQRGKYSHGYSEEEMEFTTANTNTTSTKVESTDMAEAARIIVANHEVMEEVDEDMPPPSEV